MVSLESSSILISLIIFFVGYKHHRQIACALIVDLHAKLSEVVQNVTLAIDSSPNGVLYFGHDHLIIKLFSFLRLFKHFPWFHNAENGRICIRRFPQRYDWTLGLVTPFGANFVAAVFNCGGRLKLLTMVNEIPMSIPGCGGGGFCDLDEFLAKYRDLASNCDPNKICPLSNEGEQN